MRSHTPGSPGRALFPSSWCFPRSGKGSASGMSRTLGNRQELVPEMGQEPRSRSHCAESRDQTGNLLPGNEHFQLWELQEEYSGGKKRGFMAWKSRSEGRHLNPEQSCWNSLGIAALLEIWSWESWLGGWRWFSQLSQGLQPFPA